MEKIFSEQVDFSLLHPVLMTVATTVM